MSDEAERRSGKPERQEQILRALERAPAMRVGDLARRFGVSAETIRRDLADLDARGLLARTWGGAVRPIAVEPALAERQALMVAERERIAERAVDLVERNDILMIGGGATTLHFARRLAGAGEPLTVITHAFSIAMALAAGPLVKVLMLPGQYDGREGLIHGPDTIDALARFHAAKAVLGASGLTREGPNDAALGPGLVYGAMMRRATETLVLADATKFNRPSLTVYGPWSPAVTLIADEAPAGDLARGLKSAGARFVLA